MKPEQEKLIAALIKALEDYNDLMRRKTVASEQIAAALKGEPNK